MSADAALQVARQSLVQLRAGQLGMSAFTHTARQQDVLLAALPEKYAEVWHGLLDRLESSALFSEESCSFSQTDLLDSLAMWLDKAQAQLDKTSGGTNA